MCKERLKRKKQAIKEKSKMKKQKQEEKEKQKQMKLDSMLLEQMNKVPKLKPQEDLMQKRFQEFAQNYP